MTDTLTDKQQRFVLEYLQDQNAAAAARRAGYADSTRGAHAAALMKNPLIREHIDAELADMFARLRVNAFSLMQAQSRAAFFDPRNMFGADGEPLPISDLDADTAAAVTVHYDQRPRGRTVKVRQSPRHSALTALEKRYGKFLDGGTSAIDMRLDAAANALEQEAGLDEGPASTTPAAPPRPAKSTQDSAIASGALHPLPAPTNIRSAKRHKGKSGNRRGSALLRGLLAPHIAAGMPGAASPAAFPERLAA
ncbi:MAG: hypothetical protein JWR80_6286 [Bradyrhizobium sp.]|nr:hypothetical protein [Bradyrhizobium sp.]